jgi:hypothetical protein
MEESMLCTAHLSMALRPMADEFSICQSHDGMQLSCYGESEEESRQADSEITAVNVDLDSLDDNGTLPEEEELLGEEGQSISICYVTNRKVTVSNCVLT